MITKETFGAGRPSTDFSERLTTSGLQGSVVLPPASALAEIAVLVALILAEYLWDAFPDLTRINPHPYWIAILLLSLQYGTVSGLIAAGISIVGSVLIGLPEPDIEERYFNYLIRVWTQPVLWLLVAMLLGSFRARQIEQRDELGLQVENLRTRGATLLDHATNLRARCTMLERRLAMRETADTGRLLSALARLGEAEPGRWVQAFETALDASFPRSQFSLYALDGTSARLVLTHRRGDAAAQRDIDPGQPLLNAIGVEQRALCVLDPEDDAALRGFGVAAVPVFGTASGMSRPQVIGMLKADMLQPGQIDPSLIQRLSVIAGKLSPVLERGLLSSVAQADTSAASSIMDDAGEAGSNKKWRLLKWLPGGRAALNKPDETGG